MSDVGIYYYGVWPDDRNGHFLWDEHGRRLKVEATPFGVSIDGGIHPTRAFPCNGHGIVSMMTTHLDGWTAVAFWDLTADSRPGSNSVFVTRGIYTSTRVLEVAKHRFPAVWARLHRHSNAGSQ